MSQGYVQVATDATGKRIANFAIYLPAGTAVVGADGTVSYLSSETTVFMQRVVLTDSKGNELYTDPYQLWDAMIEELQKIRRGIGKLCGDPFLEEDS